MVLTIKKKDSVTSILLFVFNAFLVERGITSVSLKKIFKILKPFEKNETAIRMGMSRGMQNGLLISEKRENEVYYLITNEALRGFKYWQETLTDFRAKISLQRSEWDGEWSLLYLDSRIKSPDFIHMIKKNGYVSFSNNLWISPYDLTSKTDKLAQSHKIGDYFQFRGKLTTHNKMEDFVNYVWPVKSLAEKYLQFLKTVNGAIEKLDMDSLNGGRYLPFLHIHGLEFFDIIQEDPQLPHKLLPNDWPGFKAAKTFLGIREQILPEAKDFVAKILSES